MMKMKLRSLCIVLVLFGMKSFSQQEYFVFIQQPSGQPFYVRIGEDSYSSSAEGHLILSSLKDSAYSMYIGFPKSKYPEQLFNISVGRKDHGYELKLIDGRWQLLDLQTLQLIRSSGRVEQNNSVKKTDTYSQLMAAVVNDTAVLYSVIIPDSVSVDSAIVQQQVVNDSARVDTVKSDTARVAKAARKKAGKVQNRVTRDSAHVRQTEVKDSSVNVAPAAISNRDKRDIIRYSTENVLEGKLMIFLDRTGPVTDTIRLIVPHL